MEIRIARHTDNLTRKVNFYVHVLGLQELGGFENHNGYDGAFLGIPSLNWHLEFTSSNHPQKRNEDPDDMLVFYYYSEYETNAVVRKYKSYGFEGLSPRNPYWESNGNIIQDPDGNKIVITKKEILIDDRVGYSVLGLLQAKDIRTWAALCKYVKELPYGRIDDSNELEQVLRFEKGTCSTKHALLKSIADRLSIKEVKLLLVLYKMDSTNTPGIGDTIKNAGLQYIPEAHCCLNVNGQMVDLTSKKSDIMRIEKDIIQVQEISPEDISDFKIEYHQRYISYWIEQEKVPYSADQIWELRELCIKNLSK